MKKQMWCIANNIIASDDVIPATEDRSIVL